MRYVFHGMYGLRPLTLSISSHLYSYTLNNCKLYNCRATFNEYIVTPQASRGGPYSEYRFIMNILKFVPFSAFIPIRVAIADTVLHGHSDGTVSRLCLPQLVTLWRFQNEHSMHWTSGTVLLLIPGVVNCSSYLRPDFIYFAISMLPICSPDHHC